MKQLCFRLFVTIVGLLIISTSALSEEDRSANEISNKFLDAVEIIDIPEGKQVMRELTWNDRIAFPAVIEYKILYEGLFDTDTPNVKGYKQLLKIKVESKGGIPLTRRYILILYKDNKLNKWKVYHFRKSEDLEYEVNAARRSLGDATFNKDQINYLTYGFWCMMAGKISEALKAYEKAAAMNRTDPSSRSWAPQSRFDSDVNIVRNIIGVTVEKP